MDSTAITNPYDYEDFIGTDINLLCRVCCNTDENLLPIFESETDEEIANKIMVYLPIKVSIEDVLPLKVCLGCSEMLRKWHEFYQSCEEADKKFQSFLSEEKLDENVIYDDEDRLNETAESTAEEIDRCVEDSIVVDSEGISDNMGVSSTMKDEFQVGVEERLSDCLDRCSGEDFEDLSPKTETSCEHPKGVCENCEEEMPNEIEITNLHLENCDTNSEIVCKMCNWTIAKMTKQLSCEICGEKFSCKISLRKHVSRHDEIYCCVCNKSFKTYTNLVAHKKLHQDSIPNFDCLICGMNMNRKYNLMVHVSSHVADNPCRICCASFNSVLLLEHHKSTHSKDDIKNYDNVEHQVSCGVCHNLFDSRYKLYMHTLSEHNNDEKKFLCHCGRIFESEIILKNHEKTHDVLYECHVCSKKFKKLRGLQEHLNTHIDIRPYKCEECGKKFKYSSNLSQHRTMHRGIRNFSCLECGKKFLRSNTLAMHLKSHSNVRKYICEYCQASFVQSSSLTKHKKTIHRFCENCGEMVGDRKQWQIHVWKKCSASRNARRR